MNKPTPFHSQILFIHRSPLSRSIYSLALPLCSHHLLKDSDTVPKKNYATPTPQELQCQILLQLASSRSTQGQPSLCASIEPSHQQTAKLQREYEDSAEHFERKAFWKWRNIKIIQKII